MTNVRDARVDYIIMMLVFILSSIGTVVPKEEMFLRKENSLQKPYTSTNWDSFGHTVITPHYVRLTSNDQSQRGGIFNINPIRMHNWEIHIEFDVHGNEGTLFGDGIAFFYTNETLSQGTVFGSKDYFRGLAVFLDTYSNHNGPHNHAHPYISAMVNNGSGHYDHDMDGTHAEVAGCTWYFRNKEYATTVAIRYEKNTLTVMTSMEESGNFKTCFTMDGVYLPTGYYIGASAATGDLSDNHDIISIKTYVLESDDSVDNMIDYSNIEPEAKHHASPRDHMDDNPNPGRWTGFRIFLVVILIIVGIAVCIIVGFLVYTRQEDQRRRFY